MKLLVIRHAIAQTREEFAATGQPDELRPLTGRGRRKMHRSAIGLRRIVEPIDLLATSPLVRAADTAEIVREEFGLDRVETLEALTPESKPAAFLPWLRKQADRPLVAIVGHEPHLGTLVTWLLTGTDQSRVPLRKGGACLLEYTARPARGNACLRWSLTPSLLRRIAGSSRSNR